MKNNSTPAELLHMITRELELAVTAFNELKTISPLLPANSAIALARHLANASAAATSLELAALNHPKPE